MEPFALHVRRGDVLDKEPWCNRNWTAKFAPDEFYTAIISRPNTATVLFSDTPEVAERLSANNPASITIDALIDVQDLSILQRDVVELLLMAHCKTVVAPTLSAFSSSAILIGGMNSVRLPSDLPKGDRTGAYDKVLARILAGPECFYNDGDFAQSFGYAFRHALNVNQHRELYAQLSSIMSTGPTYAFYFPLAMALAIACDRPDHAFELDLISKSNANMWESDRMVCASLGRLADHMVGNTQRATSDFMKLYFVRNKADAGQDTLAHYFYSKEPTFQEIFQLDPIAITTLADMTKARTFLFPADANLHDGALNRTLPLWITGADWHEMFEKKKLQQNLTNSPDFAGKQALFPNEILVAERDYFRNEKPLPTDSDSLMLLSVYAIALRLSGRYMRAVSLMYHCRNHLPEHPIFRKRLADQLLTVGKRDGAIRNFENVAKMLPKHPGLTIARASLAQEEGDHRMAVKLFEANSDELILPLNYFKSWEVSLRKLKSTEGVSAVIGEAKKRFPGHPIFERRWAGK